MKILERHIIKALIDKMDFIDQKSNHIQDIELGMSLSLVNFLDLRKQEILNEEKTLNIEDVLYSQYYWFCQFKKEYFKKYGKDEGLEQQAFKIIDNMNTDLQNGVNWSIIEQIECDFLDNI